MNGIDECAGCAYVSQLKFHVLLAPSAARGPDAFRKSGKAPATPKRSGPERLSPASRTGIRLIRIISAPSGASVITLPKELK